MSVIENVVLRHVKLPLTKPYEVSFRTHTELEPIMVEVRDRDGRTGWGEAYIPAGSTVETLDTGWRFCNEVAPKLLGKGIEEAEVMVDGEVPRAPFASSAILTALAVLKRHPALQVSQEARVPLLVPVAGKTKADLEREIEAHLDRQYRTLKIKVGWDVDADLRRVALIQEIVRGRAVLTVDANRGFDREQGCRFASRIDPAGILFFEQPCGADDWEGNAAVAKVSRVPVALDESIRTEPDIEKAASMANVKFIKLKAKRVGGIDRALRALALAQRLGLGISFGDGVSTELLCWVEACIGRGFLAGAGEMNGFLKTEVRLFEDPLPFEDAHVVLRPGYWPAINRDVLEAYQIRSERFGTRVSAGVCST